MAKTWSRIELQEILAHATPIVRAFLKGLADRGSATVDEIGVHHMAPVIGIRYAKHRGKEPLYRSVKDESTGKSVFTIEPKYRDDVASILAELPDQPAEVAPMKRRPGRPRKAEAAAPKRGPGRQRKLDLAVESLIGHSSPPKTSAASRRKNNSITIPFGAIPDVQFWMQLVAMANEAVRRGRHIRFVSDGLDVRIEMDA